MSAIVYPVPPPTSNTLTSVQRLHLMCSTQKIGRVLGCTPQFVERTPSSSYLDWSDDEDSYYRPSSRGSMDSYSLGSVRSRSTRSRSFRSQTSRPSSSSSLHSGKSSASSSGYTSYDDWSDSDSAKPPLLRLALASGPRTSSGKGSLSPLSSLSSVSSDSEEDMRFTLRLPSPRDSLVSPTFRIPSASTNRRAKMDRIRRKLGDGVPVELVFPDGDEDSDDDKDASSQPRSSVTFATLPSLPPTASSKSIPRPPSSRARGNGNGIVNARDSLISVSTPHRAHRIKRKPVPKIQIEPSRPAPPPPVPKVKVNLTVIPLGQVEEKAKKDRLSLILESPLEESPLEHEGMWTCVSRTLPQVERQMSQKGPKKTLTTSTAASEWFSEDEGEGVQMLTYIEYMKMVDDLGNATD